MIERFKTAVINRVHKVERWAASHTVHPFVGVASESRGELLDEPREAPNVSVDGEAAFPPVVVTTANGVYVLGNGRSLRWLEGSYYGLTWDAERSFVLRRGATRGGRRPFRTLVTDPDLLLRIEDPRGGTQARSFVEMRLSKRLDCHSLDLYEGLIHLPLTSVNALLFFDHVRRTYRVCSIGPRTYKGGTRYESDYMHLNSVFVDASHVWLVAHNDSSYTNRESQIIRVPRFALQGRRVEPSSSWFIATRGTHAHNVFAADGDVFWCDSFGFSVMRNDEEIASLGHPYMTRGLDWNGRQLAIGGSVLSKDREVRRTQDGVVEIWEYDGSAPGRRLARARIERSGHVCDVRFLTDSRGLSGRPRSTPAWLRALFE